MNIETIAKLILCLSIGVYGLHLFLVFRQIFSRASGLDIGSYDSEGLRFSENRAGLHKIVRDPSNFGGELPNGETEEKR
jgi:hypothetical protein